SHRLNRRLPGGNESNHVTPQDGDRLTIGAGEYIAAHHCEVDLAGRERLHPRFCVCHRHDVQAHAGMCVRHGPHEGGEEFLAIAAHWTGSNAYGQMCKEEPCHDGSEPDESQETDEDHYTHSLSVSRHCFPPFVSSHHGGHKAHRSMYHNILQFPPRRNHPSINRPMAAIQLPATHTASRVHC